MVCKRLMSIFYTVLTYLIFVGYNSGVYRNIVLNEPVMAILPIRVKTVAQITKGPVPPTNDITFLVVIKTANVYIEDITRVVISYEIYLTSLQRV